MRPLPVLTKTVAAALVLALLSNLNVNPAAAQSAAPTTSISTDILALRDAATAKEQESGNLENLIRALITENDHLYMALDKRGREVMEMREKYHGTPYAEQYEKIMASIPKERVPVDVYRFKDTPAIPPAETGIQRDKAIQEQNTLEQEVLDLGMQVIEEEGRLEMLTNLQAIPNPIPGMEKVLEEKRSALLEKNILLVEKNKRLAELRTQLYSLNSDLKSADSLYLKLIQKIDRQAQSIRLETGEKLIRQQEMIRDTLKDYALKTRELDTLRRQLSEHAQALEALKPVFEKNSADLAEANARIARQDESIRTLQQELDRLRADLARKTQEHQELQTTLGQQNDKLSQKETLVTRLERLLAEKEAAVLQQSKNNANLTETQEQLTRQDQNIRTLQQELDRLRANLNQKTQQQQELETTIGQQNNKLSEKENQVSRLERLLAEKTVATAALQTEPPAPRPACPDLFCELEQTTSIIEAALAAQDETITAVETHVAKTMRNKTASADKAMEIEALKNLEAAARDVTRKRDEEINRLKTLLAECQKPEGTPATENTCQELKNQLNSAGETMRQQNDLIEKLQNQITGQ